MCEAGTSGNSCSRQSEMGLGTNPGALGVFFRHKVLHSADASMLVLFLVAALAHQTAKPVDWQAMIPIIRSALKNDPEFRGEQPYYSIGIRRTADVTGDGVPVALVYLGTGGASTDEMTIMRIENGEPVVARFRGRDGKVSSMVFLEGASVMHTDGVEMLPEQHAVYSLHYNYGSNGKLRECTGEAYQWNPDTKVFDYNYRLGKKLTEDACRKVPQHN